MIGMGTIVTRKIKVSPGFVFFGNSAKKIKKNTIGFKKKDISELEIINETKRFNKIIKNHPLYG